MIEPFYYLSDGCTETTIENAVIVYVNVDNKYTAMIQKGVCTTKYSLYTNNGEEGPFILIKSGFWCITDAEKYLSRMEKAA